MELVQQAARTAKRIFCNHCKHYTNHVLKATHEVSHDHDVSAPWWNEEYKFWVCAGCDSGTLERIYQDEFMEEPDGKQYSDITYAPKRTERDVAEKRFNKLPENLDQIYRESITAFNDRLYVLCAAGLRALMEGICDDKGIAGGNLEIKINNMVSLLPKNIVDNLHGFRFMGNSAVHELTAPNHEDLRLAIEISEDLLNFLYELDYKSRRLLRSP